MGDPDWQAVANALAKHQSFLREGEWSWRSLPLPLFIPTPTKKGRSSYVQTLWDSRNARV